MPCLGHTLFVESKPHAVVDIGKCCSPCSPLMHGPARLHVYMTCKNLSKN